MQWPPPDCLEPRCAPGPGLWGLGPGDGLSWGRPCTPAGPVTPAITEAFVCLPTCKVGVKITLPLKITVHLVFIEHTKDSRAHLLPGTRYSMDVRRYCRDSYYLCSCPCCFFVPLSFLKKKTVPYNSLHKTR